MEQERVRIMNQPSAGVCMGCVSKNNTIKELEAENQTLREQNQEGQQNNNLAAMLGAIVSRYFRQGVIISHGDMDKAGETEYTISEGIDKHNRTFFEIKEKEEDA